MADLNPPIADHPTLRDYLGRRALVVSVAKQIALCQPPQVFGIHGDWGAGKSSFLHQLRYHLTGELAPGMLPEDSDLKQAAHRTRVVTVWFEAWRYQHETVPVVALIQEVRRQLSTAVYLKEKLKKIGEVATRSLLNSLDDAAKLIGLEAVPFSAEKVQGIGEQWEREHLAQRLATDNLQDHLTQVIGQILRALSAKNDAQPRIAVLIDDLDRCGSEAAYRLLEGLKVYLNLPNCVFILGMNQQAVVDAIAKNLPSSKDKPDQELRLRAEAYLEKLCSNIWRLPLPPRPSGLFMQWIEDAVLREHLEKALTDGATGKEIRCLPPNPRRLKALANQVARLHGSGVAVASPLDARLLLITSYVYQFHADLFHRWQYDPDFFEEMRAWLKGSSTLGCFKHLVLPVRAFSDSTQATPTLSWRSAYPDPGASEVFWVAPLMTDETLRAKDFEPYLEIG